MDSLLSIYVIVGLFTVIFGEFIFLIYIMNQAQKDKDRLLDELTKANTAISAKSAQEYVMMRSIDNVRTEEKKEQPEGVDVSELSDAEYDKLLKQTLKNGN